MKVRKIGTHTLYNIRKDRKTVVLHWKQLKFGRKSEGYLQTRRTLH